MEQETSKPTAESPAQPTVGAQFIAPGEPTGTGHPRGQMSDIVGGIFTRLRLPWLLQHHARVPVLALFSFINGCISIGIMSMLAVITHTPFIFPSLGPTAFL